METATRKALCAMQQDENTGAQTRLRGRVKWFDPVKGFGFVVSDTCGSDILLHANVLRNFGQFSVADGAGIEVLVQETPRGLQAAEVFRIDPPEEYEAQGHALSGDAADLDKAGPPQPARVKWFDKGKGFGFANVFGQQDDIFIHVEVLRRSGFADLQPGEAVALRVIEGARGRMAVLVCPWDVAEDA